MTRRLHALRVGNFKAFADTQRIPLKPITLIFGPNSAGKSSFIHSLALAHEAQFGREKRSLARLDVHHTDVGGSAIDLGSFRQYVHRGQLHKRVEWGADVNSSALGMDIATKLLPARQVCYSIAIGMELDDQDRPKPDSQPMILSVDMTDGQAEILHASRRSQGLYRIDRLNLAHPLFTACLRQMFHAYDPGPSEGETGFIESATREIEAVLPKLGLKLDRCLPSEVISPESWALEGLDDDAPNAGVLLFIEEHLSPFIKAVAAAIESSLDSFQYLGPLRSYPARHLAFSDHDDRNWYAGGGYAWDVVRRDDAVREAVNGWLGSAKLKTPYRLVVRSLTTLDQLHEPIAAALEDMPAEALGLKAKFFNEEAPVSVEDGTYLTRPDIAHLVESVHPEVRDAEQVAEHLIHAVADSTREVLRELVLVDQRTNTVVTHRDVGIGISQVLPVLVMAYGSQGKLLAMEQPEIHLHPALQAELGDVFIEAALGERQNTFILETHSEHLILRLMRRMRETYQRKETGLPAITSADVSVLYVEPDGARSIVREMPLNELGELVKSWPGGFFEEGLREQFGDA